MPGNGHHATPPGGLAGVPGPLQLRGGSPARAAALRAAGMTAGPVVLTADIPVDYMTGGARVRTLLDTGRAGPGLVRRLAEIPPGALLDGTAGSAGELWFVISGHGRLDGDGQAACRSTRTGDCGSRLT